mgnify:CR=1 FL=1
MNISADVVTFAADGALYAAPVHRVQEILDLQPVAPMPNAPAHFMGITDLRGQNVPVVDLRRLLGLPDTADTPQTRFVVVHIDRPGQPPFVLGLRTDRVIEVTRLDDDELGRIEDGGVLGWSGRAVAGIGRRNGDVVSVLDIDRLFGAYADLAEPAQA